MKILAIGRQALAQTSSEELSLGTILIHQQSRLISSQQNSLKETSKNFRFTPNDASTWNTIISMHSKHGQFEKAIKLYHQMRASGFEPDVHVYIALLKACASSGNLIQGTLIHMDICHRGFDLNVLLGNSILGMYGKCGRLDQAKTVFLNLPRRDVASWNILISGCIHNDECQEAFYLFYQMRKEGCNPDNVTYAIILKACGKERSLDQGKLVHAHLEESGLHWDAFLWNSLIDMYVRCGSLADACAVFHRQLKRDVVSWNIMIKGWAQQGNIAQALLYLWKMKEVDGLKPDKFTFGSMLKGCSNRGTLQEGKRIHEELLESRLQWDAFIGNTLIDMYVNCGSLEDAKAVFILLPKPDVVSWNTLIAGCTKFGCGDEALKLFGQMEKSGLKPDKITYATILKVCSVIPNLMQGKLIHAHLMQGGLQRDDFVGSSLIDMYAKCGSLNEAHKVFRKLPKRNVVSWNAMIAGCVQHGHCEEALQFFAELKRKGLKPNESTFPSVLKACGMIKDLNQGKLLHFQIANSQLECDSFIGSSLVNMYVKCGSLREACIVFDKLLHRTLVSYNVMIAGYAQYGLGEKALNLFKSMQQEGIKPDIATYVSALRACSSRKLLNEGKLIHAQLIKCGLVSDLWVGSSLIDMYAKCGGLDEARKVFHNLQKQDVVSWTAMIAGCAQHGYGQEALHLLKKMQNEGLKPDHATLVCALSACSHAGLLNEGYQLYQHLCETSGSHQIMQYSVCMVDLLGRAGTLSEVKSSIRTCTTNQLMPYLGHAEFFLKVMTTGKDTSLM